MCVLFIWVVVRVFVCLLLVSDYSTKNLYRGLSKLLFMGIIKVEMFEYTKAQKPDALTSGGLGPCIAVGAIYDPMGYIYRTNGNAWTKTTRCQNVRFLCFC